MNINLFSNDPVLLDLCREIVRGFPHGSCTLSTDRSAREAPPGGVRVYDLAGAELLALVEDGNHAGSIFVVDRRQLTGVRERLIELQATVILKPVTRTGMEIALEQARAYARADGSASGRDRDELLQQLIQANLRLQEHDLDRAHFLARAVHELRAPLTALNGYCDLLLDHRLGPLASEQDSAIGRMRHSVTRLSTIVSSMFQLALGKSDTGLAALSPGDYTGCIELAVHELAPLFEERRIDLAVDLAPCGQPVAFEARKVEEVFINLLDNCRKYTPRGGLVRVFGYPTFCEHRAAAADSPQRRGRVEPPPNSYRVDVTDNGPGIPVEHLDRIFEEYTALGNGSDRSGAGLGLAIFFMIVNQHHGRIWAESSPGGTTLSVVLPFATS